MKNEAYLDPLEGNKVNVSQGQSFLHNSKQHMVVGVQLLKTDPEENNIHNTLKETLEDLPNWFLWRVSNIADNSYA